ncbi:MAG: MotA/TolQ/ExbB proton channel family protein [Gammaproteobacteria bacterium]|nr:MotA/TolQ/ExbB proton channel family protein [Gammaproteobacteria bacterium]
MQPLLKKPHGFFFFVLLLLSIELFIWFYLEDTGYLYLLLLSDKSQISLLIISIYILTSLHFLYSSFVVSKQFMEVDDRSDSCRNMALNRFFKSLTEKPADNDRISSLLDVLDIRLRSRYSFGFLVADLMMKLGLLGTVIGFIIMLGSLSDLNSVDISVMQKLLADMSSGMKIALYTTLTGMLAGIFLNMKYNFLDWAIDHLMNDLKEAAIESKL